METSLLCVWMFVLPSQTLFKCSRHDRINFQWIKFLDKTDTGLDGGQRKVERDSGALLNTAKN